MEVNEVTLFVFEAVPRSPVLDPIKVARARVVAESEEEAMRFLADGLQKYRHTSPNTQELSDGYFMNRVAAVKWSRTKAEWLQSALLGQVEPPAIWLPPLNAFETELEDLAVGNQSGDTSKLPLARIQIPAINSGRERMLEKFLLIEQTTLGALLLLVGASVFFQVYSLLLLVPATYPFWKWARMIRLGIRNGTKGFAKVWGKLSSEEILAYLWKFHPKTLETIRSLAFAQRKSLATSILIDSRGRETLLYRSKSTSGEADAYTLIEDVVARLKAQEPNDQDSTKDVISTSGRGGLA